MLIHRPNNRPADKNNRQPYGTCELQRTRRRPAAEPIGLLVTLLIPPHGTEEEVEHIAQELAEAAKLANIEIIGGHTEVTASVTRYVTCAAVIARAGKNGIITPPA